MTPILAAHAVNSLPLSTFGPLLPKVGTFSDHLIIFESNFLALKGPFLLKGPFHLNVVEKNAGKSFKSHFFGKQNERLARRRLSQEQKQLLRLVMFRVPAWRSKSTGGRDVNMGAWEDPTKSRSFLSTVFF